MLSRWRTEYPQTVCGARFEPGDCSTIHKEEFQWPSLEQVARLQGRLTDPEIALLGLTPVILNNVSILVTKSKRIFAPSGENLRVRLCVIAHAGLSGHRGIDATYLVLKKFFWPKMYSDVKRFCRLCLHCSVADPRKVVPRPLGEQMHASKRNQILQYEFMLVGISDSGSTYLLVIKDDYSGFVDLVPCVSPTGDVVVDALLRWYGLFGVSLVHISDQGTHFKNSKINPSLGI